MALRQVGRCVPASGRYSRLHLLNGAMNTKPFLTLDDVGASPRPPKPRRSRNAWAVTIAIVDDGGHLLWLQRLDGAAPISAADRAGQGAHRGAGPPRKPRSTKR